MQGSFSNTLTVVLIIILGYLLRRMKILNVDTAKRLSFVVMYITLPAIILTSANGIKFDPSLLTMFFIALLVSTTFMVTGYFCQKDPKLKIYSMINLTGFNIGNFVIPFLASVLTPHAFLALCMFDIVNALFVCGGSYAIALFCNKNGSNAETMTFGKILKELSKSFPFHSYIIILCLSFFALEIPESVNSFLKTLGGANTFLCMLVIGAILNFKMNFSQLKRILFLITIRYTICIIFIVFAIFFVPLQKEVIFVLVSILLAPIPSIAPIFTMRATPELTEDSANLNIISILLSILSLTLFNAFSPYIL